MPLSNVTFPQRPQRGLRWTLAIAAAVLLAASAVLVGVVRSSQGQERRPVSPDVVSPIQGPAQQPAVVAGTDGSPVTCPLGAVPAVMIEEARFRPAPADGLHLRRGRYRVVVRGEILNASSAGIDVRRLSSTVAGDAWQPRRTLPARVAPQSKLPFALRGTYLSTHRQVASVTSHLRWSWSDRTLARCGEKGLVEDD
jgi:hypothetical protein